MSADNVLKANLEEAAGVLRERLGDREPAVGIVLGSGLGPLAEQMHVLLEGRTNGAMPSWKQLSDVELAAVATYTKNHWTNQTGTLVQPAEFKAARAGKFPAGG